MEIKIRSFDWSTERNVCYREFINDQEHQLGSLSVSYFTHRWWVLLSTAFFSQLNWGAAVWAKQPNRHADGTEAVTQSSRCQDRVVPDICNRISVEDKAALFLVFNEGYIRLRLLTVVSTDRLAKASIMRFKGYNVVFFFVPVRFTLRGACKPQA